MIFWGKLTRQIHAPRAFSHKALGFAMPVRASKHVFDHIWHSKEIGVRVNKCRQMCQTIDVTDGAQMLQNIVADVCNLKLRFPARVRNICTKHFHRKIVRVCRAIPTQRPALPRNILTGEARCMHTVASASMSRLLACKKARQILSLVQLGATMVRTFFQNIQSRIRVCSSFRAALDNHSMYDSSLWRPRKPDHCSVRNSRSQAW